MERLAISILFQNSWEYFSNYKYLPQTTPRYALVA